jgi:PelA/Pel-15E family pectate lyase
VFKTGPYTVTAKQRTPPSGDKRDYLSFAPYWWPDPSKPDGLPYIQRDGQFNMELRRDSDVLRWYAMTDAVETLAQAWYFTDRPEYAQRAAHLLRVWFLNDSTRMNPHLKYAQAIPGRTEGRGIGIIDTRDLGRLFDAIALLEGSSTWSETDARGLRDWAAQYLEWLLTSQHGKDEAAAKNNHGTWYDVQIAALALFVGDTARARTTLESAKTERIAKQIDAEGKQPLELTRTRSLHYHVENLDGFTRLAEMARTLGIDLWNWSSPESGGIRKAIAFVKPYANPNRKWPHEQITEEPADMFVLLLRRADTAYNQRGPNGIPAGIARASRATSVSGAAMKRAAFLVTLLLAATALPFRPPGRPYTWPAIRRWRRSRRSGGPRPAGAITFSSSSATMTSRLSWRCRKFAMRAGCLPGNSAHRTCNRRTASSVQPESTRCRLQSVRPGAPTSRCPKQSKERSRLDECGAAFRRQNALDRSTGWPGFTLTRAMTAEWFKTPQALALADVIVSYQTPSGAWSKRVDFKRPRAPGESFGSDDSWSWIGTLDNNSTTEQLEFLGAVVRAQGLARHRESFERGIDYLLQSQYPTGCWPQVYPLEGGYHDAATYNDDATVHALQVLRSVGRGEYAFVSAALRRRAGAAVDRGVNCIIATQVEVAGKKTVWGAQHDPISFQPVKARAYEHASLSGRESGAILDFLMQVDSPSPAIVHTVHDAAAWFRASAIRGYSYVPRGLLTEKPSAGPLWARFYELGTNRPIFSDRDGVIKYNLSEIGEERRTGYLWYTDEPITTLRRYDVWVRRHSVGVR